MNTNTNNTNINTETRKVGRPQATIKYPRGSFTIKDLAKINPDVCTLTVRNHVDSGVETNDLTLMKDVVKTGKPGRPTFRYIRTSVHKAMLALNEKKKNQKALTTPVSMSEVGVQPTETVEKVLETAVS
jgi:predicted ArsR family transcriptional regulator